MRYIFTLLVIFSLSGLVLAAPTGDTVREGGVLGIGDIGWVRPMDFIPQDHSQWGKRMKKYKHPAVLVSHVDSKNQVKVALLSHKHPRNTPLRPANEYAPFPAHPVLGKGFINVGPPTTIHIGKVKATKYDPKHVEPDKLQNLIKDINQNCLPHQRLEDISVPPDQQLAEASRTKSRDCISRASRPQDSKSRESGSRDYRSRESSAKDSRSWQSRPESRPQDSKSRESGSRNYESQESGSRDYRSRESSAKDSRSWQSRVPSPDPKLKRKASDSTSPPRKLSPSGSSQRSPARAKKGRHHY